MQSALDAVDAAGEGIFNYNFTTWYTDLSNETRDRTGDLMTGRISPDEWIESVQAMADEIKDDPDVEKYTRES